MNILKQQPETTIQSIITPNRVTLIIGLLGIVLSIFLWKIAYEQSLNTSVLVPCTPNGGCEQVLTSKYAKIFGAPVAVFGLFYYAIIVLLSLQREFIKHKLLNKILLISIIWGYIFSAYLIYLELVKIKAICFWCTISVVLIILMSIIYVYEQQVFNKPSAKNK